MADTALERLASLIDHECLLLALKRIEIVTITIEWAFTAPNPINFVLICPPSSYNGAQISTIQSALVMSGNCAPDDPIQERPGRSRSMITSSSSSSSFSWTHGPPPKAVAQVGLIRFSMLLFSAIQWLH